MSPLIYRRLPLAERLGVSREWLRRHEGKDGFPKSVKLAQGRGGATGFFASEIDAWLASRKIEAAE